VIGYLRGEVLESNDGKLIVIVGPSTGAVGYALQVPQSSSYAGLLPGAHATLHVYTHVREDVLDLYGFLSREEKELFLTLLSVTGIGPKGALGILSGAEPETLIDAILRGDKDLLTRIPGIGKKTAERVILELADPLKKKMDAGLLQRPRVGGTKPAGERIAARTPISSEPAVVRDARAALLGLGYRDQDVASLLDQLLAELPEPPARAEDLVKSALRRMI